MNGNLKPFERAPTITERREDFLSRMIGEGLEPARAEDAYDYLMRNETWQNGEYQVMIDKETPHGFGEGALVWHLSIQRLDSDPIHDWRDMQAIKNMLVGPEAEAIELYPAESRVMDTSNRFHLFALIQAANGLRFPKLPIGWTQASRSDTPRPTIVGSKQRTRA